MNVLLLILKRIVKIPKQMADLYLLWRSNLFDADWYLAKNPDVAQAHMNPVFHYLRFGGFEGRDPGPKFNSRAYLEVYDDVKKMGMNPLVHYLKYGRKEGRQPAPTQSKLTPALYLCPVCKNEVKEFLPLSSFYEENKKRYNNPFTFDDLETLNAKEYSCPRCGATDRDRLYACYLDEKISHSPTVDKIYMLDIAPSRPLSLFMCRNKNIIYHTADLYMNDVDFVVDITDMPAIPSNSYDILICSHVLEHVNDDRKALAELYRVLKPGGWGIIMVPINLAVRQIDEDPQVTDISERWRRFGQHDHVRLYSKLGFIARLEATGFFVKQLGIDYFGRSTFNKYGIMDRSILYVAERQD